MAHLEDVASAWLLELFDLPRDASVGFVTGATMANVTALAAARHEVLRRAGWDVEADGLQGAPRLNVVVGAGAHASIDTAARLLGFGTSNLVRVAADEQGRMMPEALAAALARHRGPTIVCLQAGHVNTGAFDPFAPLIDIAQRARRVGPRGRRVRAVGAGRAARCARCADGRRARGLVGRGRAQVAERPVRQRHRDRRASRGASRVDGAARVVSAARGRASGATAWTGRPKRRGGPAPCPIYAVLKTLGRARHRDSGRPATARARGRWRICSAASAASTILNDVVLNQVLVRVRSPSGENMTPAVIDRVQRAGECWVGGTTWNGEPAMRISISNWSTAASDIEQSARSILEATHPTA